MPATLDRRGLHRRDSMDKQWKLIAFDLDGTVLGWGQDITPVTVNALRRAHEEGCAIAVCTGRAAVTIPDSVLTLRCVDYVISGSGAMVMEKKTGEVLCLRPMGDEAAEDALAQIRGLGGAVQLFLPDLALCELRSLWMLRKHMGKAGFQRRASLQFIWKLARHYQLTASALRWVQKHRPPVLKVDCNFADVEVGRDLAAKLRQDRRLTVVEGLAGGLELTAKEATKGEGVAFLCRRLGIDRENVLAFGDSQNDLTMCGVAGLFVAMDNATEEVKAAADFVTGSVDEDGVATALDIIYFSRG